MIYQYVVVLKNKHSRFIDILGFLLSLISVVFFGWELLTARHVGVAYLLGVIVVTGVLIWNVVFSYKGRKVYYSRALLIAALVWMKMPYFQWLAFVFIVLALLEYQAKYSLEIGFGEEEVVINSLLKKRYKWDQFTNVILKDGIITLDFANNRILQREVEEEDDEDADEDEFNAYCRLQLEKHRAKAANQSIQQ